jgi:polar amino acid transport system substrate-binding protein
MGKETKPALANANKPWGRQTRTRRWLASSAIMVAAAVLVGSWSLRDASEDAASRVARTGAVRVGYAVEPPFAFVDAQGRVTGESPEVARAVWRRLGVERIEWVQADFASLIPQLRAGRIDQIACGMFIRPDRAKLVAFTAPSVCIEPALLVRKGNPLRLHSFQDLAGREGARLAVLAGAVEGDDAVRAGIPEDRVIAYPHLRVALESLRGGLADGLALSAPTIQQLANQNPDMERAVPFHNPTLTPGCGAFAFRLEDRDLCDRFNRELRGFIGGKPHLALIEPFGFTRESVPSQTVVIDQESTP